MSSTRNVQDLLVNVFRPTYQYDSNVGFVPSLVLSNVSEVITDRLKTGAFAVTDSGRNTFIGENAGANATANGCIENVALGYSAMAGAKSSSNNTAFGFSNFAGLSNATSNVGIGPNVTMGRGNKNILIGPNVKLGDGSGNIIIGSDISLGNVTNRLRIGNLLYGDLSTGFVGINQQDPSGALDISGVVIFRNKVGFQVQDPKYSLDVAGSIYSTERFFGGLGTVTKPVYSFEDASSSGMYVPTGYGTGAFAISTNGSPTAIFANNSVYFFRNLDVSGTFSARNVVLDAFSVQNGTAPSPTITFANDQSTGLFLVSPSNLGFTTNGVRKMVLLGNGDLSTGRVVATDVSYSGVIYGTDPTRANVIGGVTLCNGYVITSGTTTSTNLVAPGFIRHDDPPTLLDISGGNISNSLTTRSSNFRASNGTAQRPAYSFVSDPSTGLHLVNGSALGFDTSGVVRMCLSGGNLGIGTSRPVVALEVVGDVSATTYNGPGGTEGAPHYTSSDDRLTGVFFPGTNMVALTAGGVERMRISNNAIGIGTKAPTNALDVSGTLRVLGTAGDITLTNGAISIAGTPVISATGVLSNASTTSNTIGGVTLANTDLCMGSTGRILAPIVRNALTPTLYDISGGNFWYTGAISNATLSASNQIGGVTLSNRDVSLSATGRVLGVATTSNQIGGVTLSNFDLSMASTGRILGMSTTSNQIGGVTLSNFDLSMASTGRILGMSTTSNQIGGVTLSNFDLSMGSTGRILGMSTTSNQIGGVTLSNFDLSMGSTGRILGMPATNNQIGGVTLSNTNVSNVGTLTATNAIVSGYLRNALGPTQFDISGGNISNSGTIVTRGSIGIGTTAPAAILDVSIANEVGAVIRNSGLTLSNQFAYGALKIRGHSTQNMAYIEDANGSTYNGWMLGTDSGGLGSATRFGVNRVTNGLTAFTAFAIDACTGSIGFGTLSPATPLDIASASATTGLTVRQGGAQSGIGLQVTNGTRSLDLGIASSAGTWAGNTLSGDAVLRTTTAGRLLLSANGTGNAALTISGDYVGVGCTNTGGGLIYLDVCGAMRISRSVNGNNNLIQIADSSSGTPIIRHGISIYNTTGSANVGGDLAFNTYDNSGALLTSPALMIKRSNGYVGVGTSSPAVALDVLGLVRAGATASTNNGYAYLQGYGFGGTPVSGDTVVGQLGFQTSGPYYATVRAVVSNLQYADAVDLRFTTNQAGLNNTQIDRMTIKSFTGNVGIGTTNPQYQLDVNATAGQPSVNMSTWPRVQVSNVYYTRGIAATRGCNLQWSNAIQGLDSTLGTVTNDTSYGTYFVSKKPGIWAITASWYNAIVNPTISIDVSTGYQGTSYVTAGPTSLVTAFPNQVGTLTYIGYLPGDTGRYYRFQTNGPTTTSNALAVLSISFLAETPAGATGFPI